MTQPNQAITAASVGDLGTLIPVFERSLRAQSKSPKTVQCYGEAARQLLAFLGEMGMPTEVARIRREHVETFVERLVATKSPATANNRYRSLTALFKWAIDWGEIGVSPMAKMSPPKLVEVPVPVVADAEVRRLLKVCSGRDWDDRRDAAVIRLFLDTGMRLAEMAGLKVSDLDLDQQVAYVLGKGRRPRACPYGAKTAAALDRYLLLRRHDAYAAGDALWLGVRGPLGIPGIRSLLKRRARQAGVDGLHAHLFRHRFADDWLRGGGNETDLMRLAGWRSREMVSRYAASAADSRARDAYRRSPAPGDKF